MENVQVGLKCPSRWSSLVRIPPKGVNESENNDNNEIIGRRGFEPPGPAMSRLT